jgi:D-alanyl-D-alanine carboxypeptidase
LFKPRTRQSRSPAFICVGLLVCLLIPLLCRPAYADFQHAALGAETARALQQSLDHARAYLAEPGAVVLVEAPDGSQWAGASGIAHIDGVKDDAAGGSWLGPAIEPKMHLRIASITKTFTATALLQLVGEGKCRLDDTINDILGNIVPGSHEITLRMLLNMTSGLYNYVAYDEFFGNLLSNPLRSYNPRELIAIANEASGDKLVFEPGSGWSYCNTNYILLGMMIEKLSGQPYHRAVSQRILEPLGMGNTLMPPPEQVDLPSPFAHGYFFPGDSINQFQDITMQSPSAAWAAGGMISTAQDMAIWAKALAKGTLLKEPQRKEMFSWVPADQHHEFQRYGLGVSMYYGAVGHIGSIPGYRTAIYHYHGYSIVVLLNGYRTVTSHNGHYALYVFRKIAEALGLCLESPCGNCMR